MKTAALIVTTGLPNRSGVTALTSEVGGISAGQRMISSFQCAGVSLVGLVVGPENKKAERQLAQNGVVFLRCAEETADFFQGLRMGLSFLLDKFDRVFLVPGDTPLFFPKTLETLLCSTASIVIPEHKNASGYPVLLDHAAMEVILTNQDAVAARNAVNSCGLRTETVFVKDAGILLRGTNLNRQKLLIRQHNSQLARPVAEVTLCNGAPLYDLRLSMLLHLVNDMHSVRDACSMMQISYSSAWNMLNRVEDELGFPLVTRMRGGSSGSGSVLTENGRTLMEAYDQFSEQLNQTAKELYEQFFALLSE